MTKTGNKKVDLLLFELGQQSKATMLVQIREDQQVEYWITGTVLRGPGITDKQRFPFLQQLADGIQDQYDEFRAEVVSDLDDEDLDDEDLDDEDEFDDEL